MFVIAHTSPLILLKLVLFSFFIFETNGVPLSAEKNVIHAIQPSCVTASDDSTSCNIGINIVPSLVSLDGGYQYLTVQEATITESGSTLSTNEAVWTAVQTSYLDVTPVTTVGISGVTAVSTMTQYVSFITTATSPAGEAPTAVIAAVIIAPALIAPLQPVVDNAGGKTIEEVSSEIISAMSATGITITAGDASQLANIFQYIGTGAAIAALAYEPFALKVYLADINIVPNQSLITSVMVSSSTRTTPGIPDITIDLSSIITSSSSGSSVIEVTAIVDTPYTDYLDFQQYIMIASGPTPTDDDFASSTSTLSSATASCNPSDTGAAVEVVKALANTFCTGLDLSQSSTNTLPGSSSGLQGADATSVFFNFSQTADTCALGCNASYAQIITSCKFNSHNIYGQGSLQDSCGTFAMSISSAAPAPASSTIIAPPPSTPSPSPSPTPTVPDPVLQDQQCYRPDDLGRHSDILGKAQLNSAQVFCKNHDRTFTSTTPAVLWNDAGIIYYDGISPYHYTVEWIPGCMTTATQQSMSKPLGPASAVTCVTLLNENWKNCINGGTGGTRVAGCLKYNFAATVNQTQI